MSKGFSDRLKEQVERLEECSKEFSEAIADIDEDCVDLDLDDLPDIIRELKWLAEDIEKREAEASCSTERRGPEEPNFHAPKLEDLM